MATSRPLMPPTAVREVIRSGRRMGAEKPKSASRMRTGESRSMIASVVAE